MAAITQKLPVTPAQRRLLDERMADHLKNPNDVEPWSVVRDRLLGLKTNLKNFNRR